LHAQFSRVSATACASTNRKCSCAVRRKEVAVTTSRIQSALACALRCGTQGGVVEQSLERCPMASLRTRPILLPSLSQSAAHSPQSFSAPRASAKTFSTVPRSLSIDAQRILGPSSGLVATAQCATAASFGRHWGAAAVPRAFSHAADSTHRHGNSAVTRRSQSAALTAS